MRRPGIKERLKVGLKRAARRSRASRAGPRILTYHSVGERDHPMNVSPGAFREQIAWLADTHPCISVEAALAGTPGVAITFDDGYRDNLMNAQPILSRYGVPWTLFFVTGRAGGMLDHDTDPATATLLTWDEVRDLHGAGVRIGGHTASHARLSRLSAEAQRREIEACHEALRRELGEPPGGFAYPYGSALDYTAETVELVRQVGFSFALSNRYGPVEPDGDRWTARRIWIDRTDTLGFFQDKVEGRLDGLRLLDSRPGIGLRRLANRFR